MQASDTNDVAQDVVDPSNANISDSYAAPEAVDNSESQSTEISDKEFNFRQLRESQSRLQSQLDEEREARKYWQKIVEERVLKSSEPSQNASAADDEDDDLADDDWTTKKHVQKLAQKHARDIVKSELQQWQQQRATEDLPQRLKSVHPDFDSVVTAENVKHLRTTKPHIAATLAATTDPYVQALAAYDAIRAFCPSPVLADDSARMAKNATRPGTLGAAKAPSPLTEAKAIERGLTPELKAKYLAEMMQCIRGG